MDKCSMTLLYTSFTQMRVTLTNLLLKQPKLFDYQAIYKILMRNIKAIYFLMYGVPKRP